VCVGPPWCGLANTFRMGVPPGDGTDNP
jgi:hypothetical protein